MYLTTRIAPQVELLDRETIEDHLHDLTQDRARVRLQVAAKEQRGDDPAASRRYLEMLDHDLDLLVGQVAYLRLAS